MITIKIMHESLGSEKNNGIVAFVSNAHTDSLLQKIENHFLPKIESFLKETAFTGKAGSLATIPFEHQDQIKTLLVVGFGGDKEGIHDIEHYRRAVGRAIKTLQSRKIKTATFMLPDPALFNTTWDYLLQETALIASMATFNFDEFITKSDCKVPKNISITCWASSLPVTAQDDLDRGLLIAEGVNQARHWVDMPPSRLTPVDLVGESKRIATKYGLSFTSFNEKEVTQMGMGGLAGVSAGSDQDCALVILEYSCGDTKAPTVALVGKGITFDSGGLSIKPADFMETMKDDMAGAAAVINTMQIIAQLKPKVNVIGITPLSENLPSGKATKPGDILKFYNGKTAEVRNTDAEGRLILADALSYAVKHYKPDAMIDIATLTGACSYALGPFFSGMMSQHPELAAKIQAAGNRTGDRVWPLPLDNDYQKAVHSHIADICNIGSKKYRAGAITAAFFLKEFVGDIPWAHLDIAGTAFEVPDIPYFCHGATGAGIRLFVDALMNWR